MIVISMMLVVVGFVTLMLGVLGVGDSPLDFVYTSIGACIVAAVLLVVGVVRGRPSKKPVAASGGQGGDASWAGASAWNDRSDSGDTAVMERDETEPAAEKASPADRSSVQVVTAREAAGDARTRGSDDGFAPPASSGATPASDIEESAPHDDTDVVVVPKRNGADSGSAADDSQAEEADADAEVEVEVLAEEEVAPRSTSAPTAKRSTAKKAAARKSTTKKAAAKTSATKKAATKKAAAEPASATSGGPARTGRKIAIKRVTSTKASATAAPTRDREARFEGVLGDVSGVGPAKRRDLMEAFGSIEALQQASRADLLAIDGISETLADRIRRAVR